MKIIDRLLRRNTSAARVAGFVISNFIGLAIVLGGLQFYLDARSIWQQKDSFISTDYLVINKKVTSGNTISGADAGFTDAELADLKRQPWVRGVGSFLSNDFKAYMSVDGGSHSLSTQMFFEAIPDDYVDVKGGEWHWEPGMNEVPIIINKDYLALYNFGFASSAGLPQMSEGIMSGIPMRLVLRSDDGRRVIEVKGHVAGFSNRLNTILVPRGFLEEANSRLGRGLPRLPKRVIVDVSRPGDVAIAKYLDEHDWEVAGDKSASQASFLLRVVTAIVMGIGCVITLLSFFVLLLSVSLIMEKNRDKLHSLLMLGYDLGTVASPYRRLVIWASASAGVLALASMFLLRACYLGAVTGLGAQPASIWLAVVVAVALTAAIILLNILSVNRRVRSAWRR